MSVPPPSCRPNRTSTGSVNCSVKSTMAVSKQTSDVLSAAARPSPRRRSTRRSPTAPSSRTGPRRGRRVGVRPRLERREKPTRVSARRCGAPPDNGGGSRRSSAPSRCRPGAAGGSACGGRARPRRSRSSGAGGAASGPRPRARPPGARRPCLGRDRRAQRHQIGEQMPVGLDVGEEVRSVSSARSLQTLEGVLLDHLHHRRREERADVAEPARDPRGGRAETALAALGVAVIERAERLRQALSSGESQLRRLRRRRQAASGGGARSRSRGNLQVEDEREERKRRGEGRLAPCIRRWPTAPSAPSSLRHRADDPPARAGSKPEKARLSSGRAAMKSASSSAAIQRSTSPSSPRS